MKNARYFLGAAALLALFAAIPAVAQTTSAIVVATCGTPPTTYSAGANRQVTQDTTGKLCTGATVTPGGTQDVNLKQVNGASVNVGTGAASTGTQRVTTSTDSSILTNPGARTLVTLDVKTITTGGTPVLAIAVGHRTAGGLLCNPAGATINLGINEIGTAAGTTSSGDTTFILPGQCYNVAPASTAVSVISSDSSHPFSGYGLN